MPNKKNNKPKFYITDELYGRVESINLSQRWVKILSEIRHNWGFYLFLIILFITVPFYKCHQLRESIKNSHAQIVSLTTELDEVKRDDLIHTLIGRYVTEGHKTTLSDSTVYNICVECGAPYPELIVAQYKLESGSGTSSLATNANNLVGMKIVRGKRPTTQVKGKDWNGYGVYHNWQLCIIDRILLENWNFKGRPFPDETEYRRWVSSRYAEDEDYLSKLDSIVKTFKENHTF